MFWAGQKHVYSIWGVQKCKNQNIRLFNLILYLHIYEPQKNFQIMQKGRGSRKQIVSDDDVVTSKHRNFREHLKKLTPH